MTRTEWVAAVAVALFLTGLAAIWARARRPAPTRQSRHALPSPTLSGLPPELRWTSGAHHRPPLDRADPRPVAASRAAVGRDAAPSRPVPSPGSPGRSAAAPGDPGRGTAASRPPGGAGRSAAARGVSPAAGVGRSGGARPGRIPGWLVAHPLVVVLVAATIGLGAGDVAGGPVAAVVVAVYAAVGTLAWRRHEMYARSERAFVALLDAIDSVTGDLRAGLAPFQAAPYRLAVTGGPAPRSTTYGASTYAARRPFDQGVRAGQDQAIDAAIARLDAAYRISEALGAPLADLLDRVDADLRADRRLRSTVRAQTAGAQATSVLLAALPLIGLAMGAGMGAHPLRELLHTRLGAACALTAVALQCAGLGWTARLVRGATR